MNEFPQAFIQAYKKIGPKTNISPTIAMNGSEYLDSVIRSLLELSDGPFERVRAVLDEHLEDVLRVMFGRVDNAQLLEMIVTRYNGQDILGLRKLLSRAFGNCSLEREFLKAEESSVQDEVDKKVEEGQQMRRRAQRGTRRTLANFV